MDFLTKPEQAILVAGIERGYFKYDESSYLITYVAQGVTDNLRDAEERVRMALFFDLIDKYGYANDKRTVDLEVEYTIGHPYKKTRAKVDILVYTTKHEPFMLFELKSRDDYDRYFDASIRTQLFECGANADKGSGNLKYLVYYTRWYDEKGVASEKSQTIDYLEFKTFESWEASSRPNLRVVPKDYALTEKPPAFIRGQQGSELRQDVTRDEMTRIASQMHDVLWGGGKYQNELFFNLIGLFLAKIWDEKNTATGKPYKFQVLFRGSSPESSSDVASRVNTLYKEALSRLLSLPDEEVAKMADIGFDDNRVRYVVETLQDISLTTNRHDVLGDFFERIVRGELKQTKGQYLTHPHIVDFLLYAVGLDDMAIEIFKKELRLPYIVDPSCGSGTFLIHAMKVILGAFQTRSEEFDKTQAVVERLGELFPEARPNAWAAEYIYGIEINADLTMAAKVNMVGHGDGNAHVRRDDGLAPLDALQERLGVSKKKKGSYSFPVNEKFDLIVSNPPFSVPVDAETARTLPATFERGQKILDSIKKKKTGGKSEAVDTETLFIERYYQLLRPGGRLAVVLPDSVLDTTSNLDIRLFLFQHFWVRAVVSLSLQAFAPYTITKTSLLFAEKKSDAEAESWRKKWQALESQFVDIRKRIDGRRKSPTKAKKERKELEADLQLILGRVACVTDAHIDDQCREFWDEVRAVDVSWWAFTRITKDVTHPVFLAHVEDIGFKRGASGEEERPNLLFRLGEDGRPVTSSTEPKSALEYLRESVSWTL